MRNIGPLVLSIAGLIGCERLLNLEYGPSSINFIDTDPTLSIGGTIILGRAKDIDGLRINEELEGITAYVVHWGEEVAGPGVEDDTGNGDLGGDCIAFHDNTNLGMVSASVLDEEIVIELPLGTEVPANAVYIVGHAMYDDVHNLPKCIQVPIDNL